MLSEGVDTNSSSHVDLVSYRGGSNVKPVRVIRSQISLDTSLVVDSPVGNLNLVTLLEMSSESLNEVLGRDVLNGDSVERVDDRKFNLRVSQSLYLHPFVLV